MLENSASCPTTQHRAATAWCWTTTAVSVVGALHVRRASPCLTHPAQPASVTLLPPRAGTFAPSAAHLPTLARLFAANFPELRIETVPVGDPRLDEYHRQCPSRSKLSAAAAAAAVAEEPGGAAQPANGTPPLV